MSSVSKEFTHDRDCPFRRRVHELEERMGSMQATFLEMRGVETQCTKCGGLGTRVYGSTATWKGGIGGQSITRDVCDHCWGTGDEHKKGRDLRKIDAAFRTLEMKVAKLEQVLGNKSHD